MPPHRGLHTLPLTTPQKGAHRCPVVTVGRSSPAEETVCETSGPSYLRFFLVSTACVRARARVCGTSMTRGRRSGWRPTFWSRVPLQPPRKLVAPSSPLAPAHARLTVHEGLKLATGWARLASKGPKSPKVAPNPRARRTLSGSQDPCWGAIAFRGRGRPCPKRPSNVAGP